jgi:hypothetical protein
MLAPRHGDTHIRASIMYYQVIHMRNFQGISIFRNKMLAPVRTHTPSTYPGKLGTPIRDR